MKTEIEAAGGRVDPRLRHPGGGHRRRDGCRRPSPRSRIDGLVNNAGSQFPAPLAFIKAKGLPDGGPQQPDGRLPDGARGATQAMQAKGGAIVNIVADMWMGMPGMGHSGGAAPAWST